MESDKLKAQYKIDLLNLQNSYRERVKDVVASIYCEDNEQFVQQLINTHVLKSVDTE
jgi:hypothetical protein